MLRKTRKLNLAWSENQLFYRQFKRLSSPSLQLYIRKAVKPLSSRASVVVGKKISLLATHRNKIKRQIYQILEQFKTWQSGENRVIVVKQKAAPETYLAELAQLLKQ